MHDLLQFLGPIIVSIITALAGYYAIQGKAGKGYVVALEDRVKVMEKQETKCKEQCQLLISHNADRLNEIVNLRQELDAVKAAQAEVARLAKVAGVTSEIISSAVRAARQKGLEEGRRLGAGE